MTRERVQVKQEAASLEEELATARAEHEEERAEQQKRAAEVTAALEAEWDRLQHEQAESLARFTQERQQAREALETARAHILQLNAANEEATQQAASAQAAAAAAAARCAAAEAEATKTREKLREMMAHAAERVQAGLAAVAADAAAAQARAAARFERMRARVLRRDEELAGLRKVWRTLLVAHPDLDVAQEAAVQECQALGVEMAELQRRHDQVCLACGEYEYVSMDVCVNACVYAWM